jgi:hypothetical protein
MPRITKTEGTFTKRTLYRHKQPTIFSSVTQNFSFWVATMTLFAFVVGNMVGQHGWYAFWRSVLGKVDDSLITFNGMVTPIERVPDYGKWVKYGSIPEDATYRMVPQDALVPLPLYKVDEQRKSYDEELPDDVYSMGNLGSYDTGADGGGSHVGVDIRTPMDTPIRAVANGVVETTRELTDGYGRYIVIRHPNVPDPSDPLQRRRATYYSIYAHLDEIDVSEGDIVHKGQQIGLSGQSGFASGPHLHFQIDNDQAPWHPYWPFTSTEATQAHMTFTQAVNAKLNQAEGAKFTVSPMLFVQQFEEYRPQQTIAQNGVETTTVISERNLTLGERVNARAEARRKKLAQQTSSNASTPTYAQANEQEATVDPVVHDATDAPSSSPSPNVASIEIDHDGSFNRGWEKITITARDAQGTIVPRPQFPGIIVLRANFGDAEFRPAELKDRDFQDFPERFPAALSG